MDYLISVQNTTAAPLSRGGFKFPGKSTTEVTVPERVLTEIRARRGLVITAFKPVEQQAPLPSGFRIARKISNQPALITARKVGGRIGGPAPPASVEPVDTTPIPIQRRRPVPEKEPEPVEPAPAEAPEEEKPAEQESPAPEAAPAPAEEPVTQAKGKGKGKGPQEFRGKGKG